MLTIKVVREESELFFCFDGNVFFNFLSAQAFAFAARFPEEIPFTIKRGNEVVKELIIVWRTVGMADTPEFRDKSIDYTPHYVGGININWRPCRELFVIDEADFQERDIIEVEYSFDLQKLLQEMKKFCNNPWPWDYRGKLQVVVK
ncbi:MAG: hypothetical protein HY813_02940 [Candidatus Portnoybacteria bacterium]|nr:hypothetical protein [Candidatus Portnoybacteria bacterium]